jgi:RNA polymerase sigma factor (TIGR02999 family)
MSGTDGAEPPAPPRGFFPVVYDELKRLAAARLAGERAGHSLNATALVHEAYLRLGTASFADRRGFFRAAAVAMQRILVDHARRRKAARRGGGARTIALDGEAPALGADPDLVLDVDAALERLAREDPTSAEVARHRLFAGLSIDGVRPVKYFPKAVSLSAIMLPAGPVVPSGDRAVPQRRTVVRREGCLMHARRKS